MVAEEFAALFENRGLRVESSYSGFMAQCPAHEDRTPSLSISDGDKGVILNCKAGCAFGEVIAAAGVTAVELFYDAPANMNPTRLGVSADIRPSVPSVRRVAVEAPKPPIVTDDAVTALVGARQQRDAELLQRLRNKGKPWSTAALDVLRVGWDVEAQRFTFPIVTGDGITLARYLPGGEPKLKAPAGLRRKEHPLWPRPEDIDGDELWIVEGEPDTITAHSLGLPASGLGGTAQAENVADWIGRVGRFRRVNVMLDCDEPGRKAAALIADAARQQVPDVRVFDLAPEREDGYDLSDFVTEAGSGSRQVIESMGRLTEPLAPAEAATVSRKSASSGDDRLWPAPLSSAAMHGLAGEIVAAIEPHSEADPAAVLISFLVAFGNAIGRGPHLLVSDAEHATNLYAVVIGNTGSGRKGTSWAALKRILEQADPDWLKRNVSGVGSGEGVIHHVRDARYERREAKSGETADDEGFVLAPVDAGVEDKRLFIQEPEFGRLLTVASRESNIASEVFRGLWDDGSAQTLTKNAPDRVTKAMVSMVGHITGAELMLKLKDVELANGFINRFLLVQSKRSKLLPSGGSLPDEDVTRLARKVGTALNLARSLGRFRHPAPADIADADEPQVKVLWDREYARLTGDRPGLWGGATARAAPIVLRLSLIYALLDGDDRIRLVHLQAGLEVWRYADESAKYIFGDKLGIPDADRLLAELRRASTLGLSKSEIHEAFNRKVPADRLNDALRLLTESGLAVVAKERSGAQGGRPGERAWAIEFGPESGVTA